MYIIYTHTMVTGQRLYPDISGTLHALLPDFRVGFCALAFFPFLPINCFHSGLEFGFEICCCILCFDSGFLLAFVNHSSLLTVELRFLVEDLKRKRENSFGGGGSEEGVLGATRW
jgi:hypothetical protein